MIDELRSNFIFNDIIPDKNRNSVRFVNPYFNRSSSVSASIDINGNILEMWPVIKGLSEGQQAQNNSLSTRKSISVEEITAMKLKHIKKIAETDTRSKDIKECVITVPEFWSYKERQSLLDASQMAGLNVLGLINENTAGLFTLKLIHFLILTRSLLF